MTREFESVDGVEDVIIGAISNAEMESGKWRKLRHGIALDSMSNVDITPEDENPQFPIVEAPAFGRASVWPQQMALQSR